MICKGRVAGRVVGTEAEDETRLELLDVGKETCTRHLPLLTVVVARTLSCDAVNPHRQRQR
jgi:hypothetical protein